MGHFMRQMAMVFLSLCGALSTLPAEAQYTSDIDIYSGIPSDLDLPNVLVLVDNTANWSSAFTQEMAALKTTFDSLPADRFRVGIMLFSESGNPNSNIEGGYVRAGIRTLSADYQTKLDALISSFDVNNDKSNKGMAGIAMSEAYAYFNGGTPYSGTQKLKADYTGNTNGTNASKAVYALGNNPLSSFTGNKYNNSFISNCAPNYLIYVSNGPASDDNNNTTIASDKLTAAYNALGMTRPADLVISPNGQQSNQADEWARFMKDSPRRISTYSVDVVSSNTGQTDAWSALLKSAAVASGGDYFKVDATNNRTNVGAAIQAAMAKIFNQIQAVNTVFASASLPVSVNARGTYLNQVFMGMFRPDGSGKPRWRGNLKQYKFGYDPTTDSLSLVDINGDSAISGTTGFLSTTANSYWSHNSSYWVNQPAGTPPSASDAPDGEVVEKGGVGQGIRETYATSQDGRNVFTCIGCDQNTNLATSTNTQVTTTNTLVSSSLLGTTDTDRPDLIRWFRGADNTGTEKGPGGTVTVRPSVHGDVLHSRPAVLNFGGSTGVVVFYGSNDGLLRAVDGNQSGTTAGQELWGFIPQEHLAQIKRLRDNSPIVRLSTTTMPLTSTSDDPVPRGYFVDGPIGVYQKIDSTGITTRAIIYVGMRRGGRLLYALDVSNPRQPKFLWKKTGDSLSILGQTWSEPRVAKVKGYSNPVIVMGAGYDNAAEDVSPPATNTSMGNAVLVLDAFDGSVLRTFSTTRSVAADISLIDSDYDGLVDRGYAVDVAGNVYRIDFENGTKTGTSDWGMYKLAALGTTATRKFFYPPDAVVTRSFTALMLATGDREKPLATTSADRFFTLYDTRTTKGTPDTAPTPVKDTDLGLVGSGAAMDKGCYIALDTAGEKAVNAPVTAAGITYFSTNKPIAESTNSCKSNLGEARVYSAPLFCQAATSQKLIGGGLPPSPVLGVVTVSYTSQSTNQTVSKDVPFIIGAPNAKASGIEGSKVKPTITPTRKRKYWYLENAR
jgi:type IV pilus assembly protein PilY1